MQTKTSEMYCSQDTPTPRPTWRTRTSNWVLGLKPADKILRRRAAGLVEKLNLSQQLKPGGLYVDIGSGTGHNSVQMARTARGRAVRFVCVEPVTKPTKRVLRQISKRTDGHLQFIRALGNCLPLPDGVADGVSFFFVIHHIPYAIQLQVFQEVKRVLKPDGMIFLWEDTPENEKEFKANEVWDRRLNFEPKDAIHCYRRADQWQDLLAKNGFEPICRVSNQVHSRRKNEGLIRQAGFVFKPSGPS